MAAPKTDLQEDRVVIQASIDDLDETEVPTGLARSGLSSGFTRSGLASNPQALEANAPVLGPSEKAKAPVPGRIEAKPSGTDSVAAANEELSFMPIYRVVIMSWCFQFLLDLLWIPIVAYFNDLKLSLNTLGLVFAINLGVRIIPNVFATKCGVKTDLLCMSIGLMCFVVNLVWLEEVWAICVMSAGGGMTFVRAHLSVHGKMASGESVDRLTLTAKWSGAARNAGTVCAFVVPVIIYSHFGWISVVLLSQAVMVVYIVLATIQHKASSPSVLEGDEQKEGIVEEVPKSSIPWIDWVVAGVFCVTEFVMNVQAATIPTTLTTTFEIPMAWVGALQAAGQLIAMGFLVMLSKASIGILQKRPLNLLVAFSGTIIAWVIMWALIVLEIHSAWLMMLVIYYFYVCAYTAQVTMLECLTGVLDMHNSIIVMGVAEMVGCACSLVGGYAGPALMQMDPSAPFALQIVISVVTTIFLGLTLGHRAMTQMVVCETEDQYIKTLEDMASKRPGLKKSLSGLKLMALRKETFIGVEKLYRKHSATDLSASNASIASLDKGNGPILEEPLLDPRTKNQTPEPRTVLIPDKVTSTYKARLFKRALLTFDLAHINFDKSDYTIEKDRVQQLTLSHRQLSHKKSFSNKF